MKKFLIAALLSIVSASAFASISVSCDVSLNSGTSYNVHIPLRSGNGSALASAVVVTKTEPGRAAVVVGTIPAAREAGIWMGSWNVSSSDSIFLLNLETALGVPMLTLKYFGVDHVDNNLTFDLPGARHAGRGFSDVKCEWLG